MTWALDHDVPELAIDILADHIGAFGFTNDLVFRSVLGSTPWFRTEMWRLPDLGWPASVDSAHRVRALSLASNVLGWFDFTTAIALVDRALALNPDDVPSMQMRVTWGYLQGETGGNMEMARRALSLCGDNRPERLGCYQSLAVGLLSAGHLEEALSIARDQLAWANRIASDVARAFSFSMSGVVQFLQGDAAAAIVDLEEGIRLARATGFRHYIAEFNRLRVLQVLSVERARVAAIDVIEFALETGDERALQNPCAHATAILTRFGAFEQAVVPSMNVRQNAILPGAREVFVPALAILEENLGPRLDKLRQEAASLSFVEVMQTTLASLHSVSGWTPVE